MSIDASWLAQLRADPTLATRDTMTVDEVEFDLPLSKARGGNRHRHWQRRVLEDCAPDSADADAPERTPFRVLYGFTEPLKPQATLRTVLSSDLAPLAPLFQVRTRHGKTIPVAFHVLSVKGAEKDELESKGFREHTFALLCRQRDGTLDEELISSLIERFRASPSELDLAQKTILERMQPGWSPQDSPKVLINDSLKDPVRPLDPVSCRLFQADLRTLLKTTLAPADFFHSLNLLLGLHLGTLQPRLASQLNPKMDLLLAEFAESKAAHVVDLEALEAASADAALHPFRGTLRMRAPAAGHHRTVPHTDPVRTSFADLERELARLHFHLLLLVRLRQLATSYLKHQGYDQPGSLCRTPLEFVQRMQDDADFDRFLRRSTTALAVRFVHDQLGAQRHAAAWVALDSAPSGLHALLRSYEIYNRDGARNKTSTRAHRQGISMTTSLLSQGEFGVIQTRRGLGSFFELGAGLLPLLLLLAVGAERDKMQVDRFWERLADYGFAFDEQERESVLRRLRDMGLYERFSDAGEASYVRNLLLAQEGTWA